jgi:hypothetical protein
MVVFTLRCPSNHSHPREAPGYLRASAAGRGTWPAPRPRSFFVQAAGPSQLLLDRTDSRGRVEGDAVSVALPARTVNCPRSLSRSCTLRRSASMRRSPPPYNRKATVRAGGRIAASRLLTSALDSTTGRCFGARARTMATVSSSVPRGLRRTCRNRNRSAALAWLWVDAATCSFTARWLRKALISGASRSSMGRTP